MKGTLCITAALTASFFAGCGLLGIEAGYEGAPKLAAMASAMTEYHNETVAGALVNVDKDDYEERGLSVKAVYATDESVKLLPNGTIVTITKTLDDNGTPTDISDDILTVYRQFDIWSGETRTETIVRPLRPQPTWPGWDSEGLYVQEGTIAIHIDGFAVKEGTAVATWHLSGTDVSLVKLEREITGIGGGGSVVRTTMAWDPDGLLTMTQMRIRITPGGIIETHEFTFEDIEIDGEIYTKIVREDGAYAIVLNRIDPRITEHYDEFGILKAITTVERDEESRKRTVTRRFFDEKGEEIGEPVVITLSYRVLGDTVLITRERSGTEITISIRETADGYVVERRNLSYQIVFADSAVLFYDMDGNLIGTVTMNENGSWTVEYASGSVETVTI